MKTKSFLKIALTLLVTTNVPISAEKYDGIRDGEHGYLSMWGEEAEVDCLKNQNIIIFDIPHHNTETFKFDYLGSIAIARKLEPPYKAYATGIYKHKDGSVRVILYLDKNYKLISQDEECRKVLGFGEGHTLTTLDPVIDIAI